MLYTPGWETLAKALKRIMEAARSTEADARSALCRSIADRTVRVQARLGHRDHPYQTSHGTVVEGGQLTVPEDLKPEDLDWSKSRPLEAWMVSDAGRARPGYWHLEWIEVSVADVEKAFGRPAAEDQAPASKAKPAKSRRTRPSFERAEHALKALYSDKTPSQAAKPNGTLCTEVSDWLKAKGYESVSNDTILRTAGRRR